VRRRVEDATVVERFLVVAVLDLAGASATLVFLVVLEAPTLASALAAESLEVSGAMAMALRTSSFGAEDA